MRTERCILGISRHDLFVKAQGYQHAVIDAVSTAYGQHLPLVLSPDDIWLTIAQGFGHHSAESLCVFAYCSPYQSKDIWKYTHRAQD